MVVQPGLCLDTDVCVDILRGLSTLGEIAGPHLPVALTWMSSITLMELAFGVANSSHGARERTKLRVLLESLPVRHFDQRAAEVAGVVRAQLAGTGRGIGPWDTLIGSHALAEGAALATRNVREFSRIAGLALAPLTIG